MHVKIHRPRQGGRSIILAVNQPKPLDSVSLKAGPGLLLYAVVAAAAAAAAAAAVC